MTILLTPEQEAQLKRLIEVGLYESPEDFVDTSLTSAYVQTEAFNELAREKLAASQEAVAEGRVVTVPHGQLAKLIAKRNTHSQP